MFDHDHAVTIAGLRAERDSLIVSLRAAIDDGSTSEERLMRMIAEAELACVTAERDALAAQLAEVRAELAAAPKVCAIHSYALEGPCMTCGAPWPGAEKALRQERIEGMEKMRRISAAVGCPNSVEEVVEAVAAIKSDLASERARLAAYKERIAGLEQAANELHRTIAGRDVEIEAHLGRCEAADQRARSFEAALTAKVGEVAVLTATRDRLLAREHEDGRLHAQLRAELAELRARPVLTEDLLRGALDAHGYAGLTRKLFAHLGPVALPSPDRAEELFKAYLDAPGSDAEAMRHALASLGTPPTSPPAARPVFAGVSVEELVVQYLMAGDPGLDPGVARSMVSGPRRAGVAAVLARLEVSLVAPVDPEKFARNAYSRRGPLAWDGVLTAEGRKALADEARHALTAAGVPVTPERK